MARVKTFHCLRCEREVECEPIDPIVRWGQTFEYQHKECGAKFTIDGYTEPRP